MGREHSKKFYEGPLIPHLFKVISMKSYLHNAMDGGLSFIFQTPPKKPLGVLSFRTLLKGAETELLAKHWTDIGPNLMTEIFLWHQFNLKVKCESLE